MINPERSEAVLLRGRKTIDRPEVNMIIGEVDLPWKIKVKYLSYRRQITLENISYLFRIRNMIGKKTRKQFTLREAHLNTQLRKPTNDNPNEYSRERRLKFHFLDNHYKY